ncbi:MAG TPA: YciI family protein [Actinophytocola sp.]|nr:YciI family protein [Actinophytocola sp.]
MKYLLLICTEGAFDPADHTPEELDARPWVEKMTRRGVRLTGNRVRAASDATTVRVRGDETLVTDGPFAETKEQMGGFDLVECADLDEAIEVAAKHPMARLGMVEVRPFWTE